jgi:hypothetical protein
VLLLSERGEAGGDRRPIGAETRATLVAAIARGRRWLDGMITGTVTSVEQIAARFARERVGELPPGVAYMPKPWQPLNVLIAAEQARVSVGDQIDVQSPRMGDPCT